MPFQIDHSLSRLTKVSKGHAMTLKSQLKFYIALRGLTAAELSRRSGVSKQVLSSWLAGAEPKKISQVKKVCAALETSLDHLLYGTGQDDESQRVTEMDALLGDSWIGGVFEVKFRRIKKSSRKLE